MFKDGGLTGRRFHVAMLKDGGLTGRPFHVAMFKDGEPTGRPFHVAMLRACWMGIGVIDFRNMSSYHSFESFLARYLQLQVSLFGVRVILDPEICVGLTTSISKWAEVCAMQQENEKVICIDDWKAASSY